MTVDVLKNNILKNHNNYRLLFGLCLALFFPTRAQPLEIGSGVLLQFPELPLMYHRSASQLGDITITSEDPGSRFPPRTKGGEAFFPWLSEGAIDQLRQAMETQGIFAATSRQDINIHFVPCEGPGYQGLRASLELGERLSLIDWYQSTGASSHVLDDHSLWVEPDSDLSPVLLGHSGEQGFLDIVVPVPGRLSGRIYTYSLAMPAPASDSTVLARLRESSREAGRLSPTLAGLYQYPNSPNPAFSEKAATEAYIALIEMILDMIYGDYVELLPPELYRSRQYLLGARDSGLSVPAGVSGAGVSGTGPGGVHYRNWLIVLNVAGEPGSSPPPYPHRLGHNRQKLFPARLMPRQSPVGGEQMQAAPLSPPPSSQGAWITSGATHIEDMDTSSPVTGTPDKGALEPGQSCKRPPSSMDCLVSRRDDIERRIRQAFEQGALFVRGIRTRSFGEYLELGGTEQGYDRQTMRPGTFLKQGQPCPIDQIFWDGINLYLVILDYNSLLFFKRDACTSASTVKNACLNMQLPGSTWLKDKMTEQYNRWASVYPIVSSGRLTENGVFISGHTLKQKNQDWQPSFPEVLIKPYQPGEYAGILIPRTHDVNRLSGLFNSLAILQTIPGCPEELPLVFYDPLRGVIEDILWPEDLPCTLEQLQQAGREMKSYNKISQLPSLFSVLPPGNRVSAFQALPGVLQQYGEIRGYTVSDSPPAEQDIIYRELLTNLNDENKDIQDTLEEALQNGVSLNYLLQRFISATERWACDNEALARHTKVAIGLYNRGARAPLNKDLFRCLPGLVLHMISNGEVLDSAYGGAEGNAKEMLEICFSHHGYPTCLTDHEENLFLDFLVRSFSGQPELLDMLVGEYLFNSIDFMYIGLGYVIKAFSGHTDTNPVYVRDINAYKAIMTGLVTRGALADIQSLRNRPGEAGLQPGEYEHFTCFLTGLEKLQGTDLWRQTRAELQATPAPITADRLFQEWLEQHWPKAPDVRGLGYHQLALRAIEYYYLQPDLETLARLTGLQGYRPQPDVPRQYHGVDHVVRTQILAEALIPLFEHFEPEVASLLARRPKLRELIPLALVYHDVVAEEKAKELEESEAARLFTRDMEASGQYETADINLVASALHNKNNRALDKNQHTSQQVITSGLLDISDERCSGDERHVRRLVRLPDCIDILRVKSVTGNWTNIAKTHSHSGLSASFNPDYLDLPDRLRSLPAFTGAFKAMMEGAKDLAWVTGGKPQSDLSGNAYDHRYHLKINNQAIRKKIHFSADSVALVKGALDDNVRRWYARNFLNLTTCHYDHSPEALKQTGRRAPCLVWRQDQNRLTAIHSTDELRQVHIPEGLSVLEKLQVETLGRNSKVLQQFHAANSDLRSSGGLLPSLGTLSQTVLASEATKAVLKQRRIEVMTESIEYFPEYEGRFPEKDTAGNKPLPSSPPKSIKVLRATPPEPGKGSGTD